MTICPSTSDVTGLTGIGSAWTVPGDPARQTKETSVSVKKNFYSDNVSGAAPEILEALVAANAGDSPPYGADPVTEGLQARFAKLFETEVEVYPVGTGCPSSPSVVTI